MKKLILVLGMPVLFVLLSGCQHHRPVPGNYGSFQSAGMTGAELITLSNQLDQTLLEQPTNLFALGPGDRLEIELLDDPASRVITVVGPDGKVYFNLLPGLDVWGLTLGETKALIEREMGNYVRGTPQVNITLREVESKRVWLLGRFQAPGVYNMRGPMTLLEAISMAGGSLTFAGTRQLTGGPLSEDLADLDRSFIIRNGELLPVNLNRLLTEGDLSQNVYLHPDDFVYFSPAYTREVYVLGAVVQPKPVQFNQGLTLASAIAGAYGTVRDAHLREVVIIRGSLSEPQANLFDYKAILEGRIPDVQLQPHDIVYVPLTPYRYLRKYAEIALNTFVSSVAINAGTRVMGPPSGGGAAGIFIPVGSNIQVINPPAPPIR